MVSLAFACIVSGLSRLVLSKGPAGEGVDGTDQNTFLAVAALILQRMSRR
jgi:hypothetical protein